MTFDCQKSVNTETQVIDKSAVRCTTPVMASFVTGALFDLNSSRHRREEPPSFQNANSPQRRFPSLFGTAPPPQSTTQQSRIHAGPQTDFDKNRNGLGSFIRSTPESFYESGARTENRTPCESESIRLKVVNERDAHRGFRMFDGIQLGVKDVSSEELFLERMHIAYTAFDTHVAGLVTKSPLDITKALVRAVSACLTKYFSTQSTLRTNRPFIAKVLNLDCDDMFCAQSDFMQSFLFTNASEEDESIIAMAEKVYTENDFDVCTESGDTRYGAATAYQTGPGGDTRNGATTSLTDQLFDFGTRIAERSIVGGTQASFSKRGSGLDPSATRTDYAALSDELPFQSNRKDPASGDTTAMLILVTDVEALHNYVAYVLYLTPPKLSRRYNVSFDCLQRPTYGGATQECCRAREARKRKRDNAKAAIRDVIEKKRREKIDNVGARSSMCDAVRQMQTNQTVERNGDLLRHVLLMLFDKCLTALIDRGFENLNARRGYAVNSAKEIGSATIYTGIIDTIGEVSANLEGHAFDSIAKGAVSADGASESEMKLFTVPDSTIVSEVTSNVSRDDVEIDGATPL